MRDDETSTVDLVAQLRDSAVAGERVIREALARLLEGQLKRYSFAEVREMMRELPGPVPPAVKAALESATPGARPGVRVEQVKPPRSEYGPAGVPVDGIVPTGGAGRRNQHLLKFTDVPAHQQVTDEQLERRGCRVIVQVRRERLAGRARCEAAARTSKDFGGHLGPDEYMHCFNPSARFANGDWCGEHGRGQPKLTHNQVADRLLSGA